jgi:2-keto-3-deoxy-L-fuconate dehydrogenase
VFRLEKKIAFVTGAGSGIGESIARLFAQQGAHVVLADLREDAAQQVAREIQEAGGSARVQPLDVAEESQVKAAIGQAAAAEGRLDILVNNAGISHVGNILETSLEDWELIMRVNARGVFLCAREGVRQMLAQSPHGGTIINMASVAAMIGIERRLPYCASKGAVLALTRSIAIDFATQGIRCNAICPGTVQTPSWRAISPATSPDTRTRCGSSCTPASPSDGWAARMRSPAPRCTWPRTRPPL